MTGMSAQQVPTLCPHLLSVACVRFEQIGASAAAKLIEGILDESCLSSKGAVFLVEVNLTNGSIFDGFVVKRTSYNFPLFYIGMTEDSMTRDWFVRTKTDLIATGFLNGTISIPGCAKPPDEPPADLLEAPPEKPKLNVLTTTGADGCHPKVPEKLVQERHPPQHTERFSI